MNKLSFRSIYAVPLTIGWSGCCASAAWISTFFDKSGNAVNPITLTWAKGVSLLAGMKTATEGAEQIDPGRTYVVVSNHQSHMDTIALYITAPVPLRMLAKESLFKIPIFGPAMLKAGHIKIYRDKNRKTDFARLMKYVTQLKEAKRSVMVFAEGTRSPDGKLTDFKKGAFAIASEFNLPILPVTIIGTGKILPPKTLRFYKGNTKVIFHKPFEADGQSIEQLKERTHQAVASAL